MVGLVPFQCKALYLAVNHLDCFATLAMAATTSSLPRLTPHRHYRT
jgi:hypothetical protein